MPYFFRNWRTPWWRRRRRRSYWTRRPRRNFRRRRYRRKWVRKLKTLKIKEWQPTTIRKTCVKGLHCLFQAHHKRVNKNYAQYQSTVTPQGTPGGGSYSILRFNLNCLFTEHEQVRNVWTKSNKYLPFVRYLGCTIKIYRPAFIDAVVRFQTCYPMTASNYLYAGCQPSVMMQSRHAHIIPSKITKPHGKQYVKFRLPPPQNMQNKWYFQKHIAQTGLLLIQTAACSLDQYYISKHSDSDTIELYTLNTKLFTNLNFKNFPPTTGYQPNEKMYLWSLPNGDDKYGNLIYLGNSIEYQEGKQIKQMPPEAWKDKISTYMTKRENWGNPFTQQRMHKQVKMYFSTIPPLQVLANKTADMKIEGSSPLTELTQELFFTIRYNPREDTGKENQIYLKSNWKENETLDPPTDENLRFTGFPNWLSCWGFVDYHMKLGRVTQVPTKYITVIKTTFFTPQLPYYLLIDKYFTEGDSEYLQGRLAWENLNWYPMNTHQDDSLNTLALSGPGTPKLGDVKTAECKCEYKFYFKVGGCAPPMEKVADPKEQPDFPLPNNQFETNSLQSPTTPIEHFLYSFDQRRDEITASAAKRIRKDPELTDSLFTDSTTTGTAVPAHQTFQEDLLSSEEEEAQEKTLFEQLQQHRLQQQQLRHRIKQLLAKLQTTQ